MEDIIAQLQAFPPEKCALSDLTETDYDKQAKLHVQTLLKAEPTQWQKRSDNDVDLLELLDPAIYTISYLLVLLSRIRDIIEDEDTAGHYEPSKIVEDAEAAECSRSAKTTSRAKRKTTKRYKASAGFRPDKPTWKSMQVFAEKFDAVQTRYCGHDLRSLIELIADAARSSSEPEAAIVPIRKIMLRVDPSGSTFTSSHTLFARLCLAARCFRAALPILDLSIFALPGQSSRGYDATMDLACPYLCSQHDSSAAYINISSGLTGKIDAQDYMQYFLFGAMCYLALENWQRAQTFLEVVIIAPTSGAVSKIQVDAFHKLSLLSLVRHGKTCTLPKMTSAHVSSLLMRTSKLYTSLSETFAQALAQGEGPARFRAEIELAQSRLREDGNLGLAEHAAAAYRKFRILKLQEVFKTMTVAEAAQRISGEAADTEETRYYLQDLIDRHELNASLVKSDEFTWQINFADSSSVGWPADASTSLQAQTLRLQTLTHQLQQAERRLLLSKDYVQSRAKAATSRVEAPSKSRNLNQLFEPFDDDMTL